MEGFVSKTVMLCERPTMPMPKAIDYARPPPFYSSVAKREPLGFNRPCDVMSSSELIAAIPKKKDLPYLDRHRRYLQDLSRIQRSLRIEREQQIMQEEAKKKETTQRWINRRELRQSASEKSLLQPLSQEFLETNIKGQTQHRSITPNQDSVGRNTPSHEDFGGSKRPTSLRKSSSASSLQQAKKKAPKKPTWAMTEEQICQDQDLEVEELIDFVSQLNFDEYIDSLEKKSEDELLKIYQELDVVEDIVDEKQRADAINKIVSNPVSTVVASPQQHTDKDFTLERLKSLNDKYEFSAPQARLSSRAKPNWQKQDSTYQPDRTSDREDIVTSRPESVIADKILHSAQNLRNIHSAASLRAIIKERMYRLQQRDQSHAVPLQSSGKEKTAAQSTLDERPPNC
eukprot:TRINITY_DN7146_c0_g1_i4.p1 TRINITY_DN7146_c0_g1~~TRINITY_DN7146_c0_g1_i4.p1  ORF type:complete len:400 (-),score=97.85 TRINITY_DN7146_c0_g1_i4:151-1350(-)